MLCIRCAYSILPRNPLAAVPHLTGLLEWAFCVNLRARGYGQHRPRCTTPVSSPWMTGLSLFLALMRYVGQRYAPRRRGWTVFQQAAVAGLDR